MFTVCIVFSQAVAADLGNVGKTYPIAEKDALVEIEEKAKKVDWQKVLDKKKAENFKPANTVHLPRAKRDSTRMVDMSYTTKMDVPDANGGTLYPKGYTFNPLEYVTYSKTLVIINGNDKKQVTWLKNSEYYKRFDVMVLLTEGSYSDIAKQIARAVFYANRQIIERLQLKAVPSVARQKGKLMEVVEYLPEIQIGKRK